MAPEKNKMKQISCAEGTWINEGSLPVTPAMKVIRAKDPWHGMSEEKVEDQRRRTKRQDKVKVSGSEPKNPGRPEDMGKVCELAIIH